MNIKSAIELEEYLESLYAEDALHLHNGKVSLFQLSQQLGESNRSALSQDWGKQVIARYNELLQTRGHGTVWDMKAREIRKYLENLHSKSRLPINNRGKLNKKAVLSHFGLPPNGSANIVVKRSPILKNLFLEYDDIIAKNKYSRYRHDHLAKNLENLLENSELTLFRNKIISIKILAEYLCKIENKNGNPINADAIKTAIKVTPSLRNLIQNKQNEVNRKLRSGSTSTHFTFNGQKFINLGSSPLSDKHKRVFSFTEIIDAYSLEFAEKIGTAFIYAMSNIIAAKVHYHALKKFLLWLASDTDNYDICQALSEGGKIAKEEFERSALRYKQSFAYSTLNSDGKSMNKWDPPNLKVIERLGEIGVFPNVHFPTSARSRLRNRDRSPKPSMVEAKSLEIESIRNIIQETAAYRGIIFNSNKDTIAFANTLAFERLRRNDLPNNLSDAIAYLCERRIHELKKVSSRVFRDWHNQYQHGRALLPNAKNSGSEIYKTLNEISDRSSFKWHQAVAKFFPKKDPDAALANLLDLLDKEFHGLCPQFQGTEFGQFWAKQYQKIGGAPQAYLLPTSLAVSAAACLYLCESGSNPSVALCLEPDGISPSKLPRHVNITSTKSRSKGKSIFSEHPSRRDNDEIITAEEALSIINDATQRLRDSGLVDKDKLLVWANNGVVKALSEDRLREDTKELIKASEELSEFNITPSMIRPTVLLHTQLKNPANLSVANIIAQHNSETTTMGYVAKLPFRIILEERIRRFTETIEVVAATRITDAHNKLGIPEFEWKARIENAKKTGMGIYCANPFAGSQPDYPAGKTCQALDRCIECSQLLVIADEKSIADMIIWREALENSKAYWLENKPQRWESVWTPWLAFFEVVLDEKMSRGELALIKRKSIDLVKQRKLSNNFNLPEPW